MNEPKLDIDGISGSSEASKTQAIDVSRQPNPNYAPTSKSNIVFDPRIIENDKSKVRLWSTQSVELALRGLKDGYKLVESPFNAKIKGYFLRRNNLPFKYEPEEIEIIKKCAINIKFFGNNFVELKDADKGWTKVKLRYYQENLLDRYDENRWNIIMFPRQSGKTTTTVVKIVHFLTFNVDKDVVVVAQSDKVVGEILEKIKSAFSALPFFLQPGFISFTEKGCALDNGCRLSIGIASESVVQGFSLDLLYIDEFAYISPTKVDKFWVNIYPALLNNPKSRCIVTSTPNGRNKFHELWTAAIEKRNSFIPYRIYWTDVPRAISLEEFKKSVIQDIGETGWLMGYECSFDIGLKTIFTIKTQKYLRECQEKYHDSWCDDNLLSDVSNKWSFIDQDVIPYDIKNDFFLWTIDIGEGLGEDYSAIKIYKIDWDIVDKCLKYYCIGVYHDNEIAEEDLAVLFLDSVKKFNLRNIKVIVESNTYGGVFFHEVKTMFYYKSEYKWFTFSVFAKFWRDSKDDYDYGVLIRSNNKNLGVKGLSKLINNMTLLTSHYYTIEEYLNFGRQSNGSYKANYGNDDLVTPDVSLAFYLTQQNVYATEFLKHVEYELRIRYDDKTFAMKEEEMKNAKKKVDGVIKLGNREFHVRNHEDAVCEKKPKNILLV